MKTILKPLAIFLFVLAPVLALARPLPIPEAPKLDAHSYVLMDAQSGQLLAASKPDLAVEPASITKLMSVYIVFDAIKDGYLSLDDKVSISAKAAKKGGSTMFIEQGSKVSVENLLHGVVTASGNDATIALAEQIAGTENAFADYMNRYADVLGLQNSHFENATGWPADNHRISAHDMARIMAAIIHDFPDLYDQFFHQKEFTYNGITQPNRNTLLALNSDVDGGKTGHTNSAGYELVASAKKDGMRLITAVTGTKSSSARTSQSNALLNYGYRFFRTKKFYDAGEKLTDERIWRGSSNTVPLVVKDDIYVSFPRQQRDHIEAKLKVPKNIEAPVEKGEQLGVLKIHYGDKKLKEVPLYAGETVDKGGMIHNLIDSIKMKLQ